MLSYYPPSIAFQRLVLRYILRTISCEIFASAISCYEDMRYASATRNFSLVCRLTHSRQCLGDKASDALFNLSSIMHMVGFPELACKYLEPILVKSVSGKRAASMNEKEEDENEADATAHQS